MKFNTKVMGEWAGNRQEYIKRLSVPDIDNIFIRHEPSNPYDANALQVLDKDGNLLGYIPRGIASSLKGKITGDIRCPSFSRNLVDGNHQLHVCFTVD